ncbi:MAG: hypothetical protein VYE00_03875, partial [Candidatus Poribacteria bacterium]|nr:hypothetical protein [Candidatus Poribacteria bacterium]
TLPNNKVFQIRTDQDNSVTGRYTAKFLADKEGKYTLKHQEPLMVYLSEKIKSQSFLSNKLLNLRIHDSTADY